MRSSPSQNNTKRPWWLHVWFMCIGCLQWVLIKSVIVWPFLSCVRFGSVFVRDRQLYWQRVLATITPLLLWLQCVSVKAVPQLDVSDSQCQSITEGLFSCLSLVDVLIMNRMVTEKKRIYYAPIHCSAMVRYILTQCGYRLLSHDTVIDADHPCVFMGVVPPQYCVKGTWELVAMAQWVNQGGQCTVLVNNQGTDLTTDYRSVLTCWTPQCVTVAYRVVTWPLVVNQTKKIDTMTRWLDKEWQQLTHHASSC